MPSSECSTCHCYYPDKEEINAGWSHRCGDGAYNPTGQVKTFDTKKIEQLEALVVELRQRDVRMRETSHQWMIRCMSMETAMKKAGVCWYGG